MSWFVSDRERRLWLWALAVVVAIYLTLGFAKTLADVLTDRNLLDNTAFITFLVLGAAVVGIALGPRTGVAEVGIVVAVAAAYVMAFLRMASPIERSHLVEYGLVAVLVLEALRERSSHGRLVPMPTLIAFAAGTALGTIDELLQVFIPSRVFDPIDIFINVVSVAMALIAVLAVQRVRRWRTAHHPADREPPEH